MIVRALRAIRQKPKHVRDQFAFWIATSFTACVALLWIAGLPGQTDLSIDPVANTATVSSFSTLIDGARDGITDLTDATEQLEGVLPETTDTEAMVIDPSFIEQLSDQPTSQPAAVVEARMVRIATTSASTTP